MSASLRWAGGYLIFSALVLAAGRHGWMVAAHVVLLFLLYRSIDAETIGWELVAEFGPMIIATAVAYAEVPTLVATVGGSYHDALAQHWELLLFHGQPARTLAGSLPSLPLSELLHGGYMAFYLATFFPPLLLYLNGNRIGFAETVLTLTVTWIVCCVLFVFFPVQGPRYLWPTPAGTPDGPLRRLSAAILVAGSARGAAFPSLHMAASVSQTIMAWRWQSRWVRWAVSIVSVLVGIGAVYAGYHYAVDMLAGAVMGVITASAVIASKRRAGSPDLPRGQHPAL